MSDEALKTSTKVIAALAGVIIGMFGGTVVALAEEGKRGNIRERETSSTSSSSLFSDPKNPYMKRGNT